VFQSLMFSLTMTAAISSATAAGDSAAAVSASREILHQCGAGEAPLASYPDDWMPAASAKAPHAALRKQLGEPMPEARSMVSIHAVGGDLATTEFSVILVRGDDGVWRGTAVGETKVWIDGIKPSLMPRAAWALTTDLGHRLDDLLADRCFYAEPTEFHRKQVGPVGSLFMTLETQTPERRRVVDYKGNDVAGLTKEVTELAFPPSS